MAVAPSAAELPKGQVEAVWLPLGRMVLERERQVGRGAGRDRQQLADDAVSASRNEVGIAETAGSDHRAASAPGDLSAGSEPNLESPAREHRADGGRSGEPNHSTNAAINSGAGKIRESLGDSDARIGWQDHRGADADRSTGGAAGEDRQGQGRPGESQDRLDRRDTKHDSANQLHGGGGHGNGSSNLSSAKIPWNLKFKQKSAAIKKPENVKPELIRAARFISPIPYLHQNGYEVKKEGNHYRVSLGGDHIYRLSQTEEKWLWCDKLGQGGVGGDNIDLVNEINPGTKFSEAVYQLTGASELSPAAFQAIAKAPKPERFPSVPAVSHQDDGRAYLNGRGIDDATIAAAEKSGFLTFFHRAICFLGRDETGRVRSATKRSTDPYEAIQKRDLSGSSKTYSPVLPGDSDTVFIVEGGLDALALHSMAKRDNKLAPTVIVSGGAGIVSFIRDNKVIQSILKLAKKIVIGLENEDKASTQVSTDAAHNKQQGLIQEIGAVFPILYKPDPAKGKDFADQNLRAIKARKAKEEADAATAAAVKQQLRRSYPVPGSSGPR